VTGSRSSLLFPWLDDRSYQATRSVRIRLRAVPDLLSRTRARDAARSLALSQLNSRAGGMMGRDLSRALATRPSRAAACKRARLLPEPVPNRESNPY
jgi:hypothetical protein